MITITIPKWGRPRYSFRDNQEVPTAAHLILLSTQGRVLLLRRRGNDFGGHWGMPGGGIDPSESPLIALLRELVEEIGVDLKTLHPALISRLQELEVRGGSQGYALGLTNEFVPVLNDEHDAYQWVPIDDLPDPMHPNARAMIRHFHQTFRGFTHG